jgi:hypothetical protein
VANELFSLMQGPRKQCYRVIGLARHRTKNIYLWITDDMLDHQLVKLKHNQRNQVAICGLQAIATIDQLQAEAIINRTPGGRPTGSTIEAS